jgi:hypothetical protein
MRGGPWQIKAVWEPVQLSSIKTKLKKLPEDRLFIKRDAAWFHKIATK